MLPFWRKEYLPAWLLQKSFTAKIPNIIQNMLGKDNSAHHNGNDDDKEYSFYIEAKTDIPLSNLNFPIGKPVRVNGTDTGEFNSIYVSLSDTSVEMNSVPGTNG